MPANDINWFPKKPGVVRKFLHIYRLTYDFRNDGVDEWTEVIVIAINKNDAIAACGFGAFPNDQVTCEHIGSADESQERALICSGIHNYPPFEAGDEVKLAMDFFPGADVGATGEVRKIEYDEISRISVAGKKLR